MRVHVVAAIVALVLGVQARAEVKTREVTFPSGKEEVKGFLAEPEGKGPFPAVVVIQEWWGLNDWVKDQAKRLAEQGYVALAPDLYRGKVTDDMRVASALRKGMPEDRALRDLKGAVDFLAARDNVNKEKIGSIGWCMGGALSLQLALNDKRVSACAICYGAVVTKPEALKGLNASVLGIFGKEDKGIPIKNVRAFGAALKDAGKTVEGINEYEAGHGFMREKNGPDKANQEYRADEAKAAREAIDKFFAKTLKGM
jgi:carboxymethylenebutenolidase